MTDSTFNAKSMVARVLKDVLSSIADGEYAGTLPPQELLAKKLGVSRSVMREALVILRFCNVLVMRPKTGTTINARSEWKAALLDEPVNNPAIAAILFVLDARYIGDGMDFLRYWNEGEFDHCRREWPRAPDECYIGADPFFKPREARDE